MAMRATGCSNSVADSSLPGTAASHTLSLYSASNARNAPLHEKVKHVKGVEQWGLQVLRKQSSLLLIRNDEFLYSLGNRIIIHSDSDSRTMTLPSCGIQNVNSMSLSSDSKYLAVSADIINGHVSTATLILYDLETVNRATNFAKSTVIVYTHETPHNSMGALRFTCSAVSEDNTYILCCTNHATIGVLLYDLVLGTVLKVLDVGDSIIHQLSFDPSDSSRLCSVGSKDHFRIWRCNERSTFSAQVAGIPKQKLSVTFTCHCWLGANRVVAGTSSGFLALVQGTDLQHKIQYAFDSKDSLPITQLLVRDDVIIASSSENILAVYEMKRVTSAGSHDVSVRLELLVRIRLQGVRDLAGVQWRTKGVITSFELYVASSTGMYAVDSRAGNYRKVMGNEQALGLGLAGKGGAANMAAEGEWIELQPERCVRTGHWGSVDSLSLSRRADTFVSVSRTDNSVRVWHCSKQVGQLEEEFSGKNQALMPRHADMHPSGYYCALAYDDYFTECVLREDKLEETKKVLTKVPFTGPKGEPMVNQSPVSLVRYSPSGHLLAVVTGKLVQVFHMYDLEYGEMDSVGRPRRVMTLSEHSSVVTDLCFSRDDSYLVTTTADGALYSWPVYSSTSSAQVLFKGFYGKGVTITPGGSIVTLTDYIGNRAHLRRNRVRSMTMVNNTILDSSSITESELQLAVRSAVMAASAAAAVAKTSAPPSSRADEEQPLKQYIVSWSGGTLNAGYSAVYLDSQVEVFAAGMSESGVDRVEICAMGCGDGRVLIAPMPLPVLKVQSAAEHRDLSCEYRLNESLCKQLTLHVGPVKALVLADSGTYLISSGSDGVINLMTTLQRVKDVGDVAEFGSNVENKSVVTAREELAELRQSLLDAAIKMTDARRDHERTLNKVTEMNHVASDKLERLMTNEVRKRDDIILRNKEEQIKESRRLQEELQLKDQARAREVSELEVYYEKKLTQESLYLEKMRQAYEEFVVHCRMDLAEFQKRSGLQEQKLQGDTVKAYDEAARQKHAILKYVEYVDARHNEVLREMEAAQMVERARLKEEKKGVEASIEGLQRQGREELAKLSGQIVRLQQEVIHKDDEVMRMRSDLEWTHGRINKLEATLTDATVELKKRADAFDKIEFKAGDQQQQINELERIRKALTSQLHSLREELGPKEEKLLHVSERMQEIDREYVLSLNAISQKEQNIAQQTSHLHLLQKQVRELRHSTARREGALKRAAKLFDEYQLALQGAQFNSYKKTVLLEGADSSTSLKGSSVISGISRREGHRPKESEMVEIIATNKEMTSALGRLKDLLLPFTKDDDAIDAEAVNEAVAASIERERHVSLLHKSVDGLKANLGLTAAVATQKVNHHIADNATLLAEVNRLRHELRQQSLENQRLLAQQKLQDVLRNKQGPSSLPKPSAQSRAAPPERPAARESDPHRKHSQLVVESEQERRRSRESLLAMQAEVAATDQQERRSSRSDSNPSLTSAKDHLPPRASKRVDSIVSLDDSLADSAMQLEALFDGHMDERQVRSGGESAFAAGASAESKIDALMAWNDDYLRASRATTPDNVLMQHQNKHMLEMISRSRTESGTAVDPLEGRGGSRDRRAVARETKVNSRREIVFPDVPAAASGSKGRRIP